MKRFSTLLLVASVALIAANSHATTVIPPTFDQLVNEAELIFQGAVTSVKSQWVGEGAEHRIVTYVTFKIDDAIKGSPGDSYTIQMLGGTVGDQTMEVTDTPKFNIGDRDILFVEHNGTQFVPLVGIMHGRFRLQPNKLEGGEMVSKNNGAPLADTAKLGTDERAATTGRAVSATDFKAEIRAKLSARK
jgi:hypothetical protein